MKIEYEPGATPLDLDEINGLIPSHIVTQGQLNEWEAANILSAVNWLSSTTKHGNFLTFEFTKLIHKKMFEETWEWAGTFRKSAKNIGVEPHAISTELKKLLEDVTYQITHRTYPTDEIAYRFHHKIVWIHLFPNRNGRHARTITDFLLHQMGQPLFTWGKNSILPENQIRKKYIQALRKADQHDYKELAAFVRS